MQLPALKCPFMTARSPHAYMWMKLQASHMRSVSLRLGQLTIYSCTKPATSIVCWKRPVLCTVISCKLAAAFTTQYNPRYGYNWYGITDVYIHASCSIACWAHVTCVSSCTADLLSKHLKLQTSAPKLCQLTAMFCGTCSKCMPSSPASCHNTRLHANQSYQLCYACVYGHS